MTVTEHIRAHLLSRAFPPRKPDFESLAQTEWSSRFERFMRNRLIMGALRYSLLSDPSAPKYDTVGSIIRRAEAYRATGNQEHLVDIANLALVEFERPSAHPAPVWCPADDGQHTGVRT